MKTKRTEERRARLIRWLSFALTSSVSFGIDVGAFAVFYHFLFRADSTGRLLWSVVFARVLSLLCNFLLNRAIVFRSAERASLARALLRYLTLAGFVMIASYVLTGIGVRLLSGCAVVAVKIAVDTALFAVSYLVQHRWVYRR